MQKVNGRGQLPIILWVTLSRERVQVTYQRPLTSPPQDIRRQNQPTTTAFPSRSTPQTFCCGKSPSRYLATDIQ